MDFVSLITYCVSLLVSNYGELGTQFLGGFSCKSPGTCGLHFCMLSLPLSLMFSFPYYLSAPIPMTTYFPFWYLGFLRLAHILCVKMQLINIKTYK